MATCSDERRECEQSLFRMYDFPTDPIPRMSYTDPEADEKIAAGLPVILTDTKLAAPALKWSLDYLSQNMDNMDFSVYESDNHLFKYYNEQKAGYHKDFRRPIKRVEMKFSQFVDRLRSWKPGDKRLYLQQGLTDGVGSRIVVDFSNFNWEWVTAQQKRNGWGPLTSNLLLIGMEDNITPCHYDEQENFFCQIMGYKRAILFPPSQFECLYPHPIHHPHDRQCMVDLENPDYERFPKFRNVRGFEAVLGPGDVMYLPMYWFHQFESKMKGGTTASITFWYKAKPTDAVEWPLTPIQKVAMMRNIEKLITDALKNHEEVYPFMQNMVLGRYTR